MPKISVVLPTYDRERTLRRAINSVLGQSHREFELIVVDDASTDGTSKLVDSIRDPRLHYLRLSRNRGAAGARNAGIEVATGDWIAFQDSDDEWLENKLAAQWAVAKNAAADVGLVLGGYLAELGGGQQLGVKPWRTLAGQDPTGDVLDGWPIITPTWLARRYALQELDGFDESYPCLEDWDLALRLSALWKVRAVEGPVLVKHQALDSICADERKLSAALERILASHGARWRDFAGLKARRLAHLGCLRYRIGQRDFARAALREARRADPRAAAPLALWLASYAGGRVMNLAQRAFPRHASMAP